MNNLDLEISRQQTSRDAKTPIASSFINIP